MSTSRRTKPIRTYPKRRGASVCRLLACIVATALGSLPEGPRCGARGSPPDAAEARPPCWPGAKSVYFDARRRQAEYAGPGREVPEPDGLQEVRIGYFGPHDPRDPDGGDLWRAAQMAVDEANAQGGYHGKPFRLLAGWSENPWGSGVAQLARMVYRDRVWAIVGGIDGPSTHLAEQVVAKARLALISPASSDKTVNLANVPWVFSCVPGDDLLARALAGEIAARMDTNRALVLVSTDEHDPHRFVTELSRCLAERRIVPRYHFQCRRGTAVCEEVACRVARTGALSLVIAAGPRDTARLVLAVRKRGFSGAIFGGPAMGRRRFLDLVSESAGELVFPLPRGPLGQLRRFAEAFEARFGLRPDYAATHTYDAVSLLVAAVRKAGLNRARIRDEIARSSPWPGVAGEIRWDGLGAARRAVRLSTIRDGAVVSLGESEKVHGQGDGLAGPHCLAR